MSDLPERIEIHEKGPHEGFQIEPGSIVMAERIVGHALSSAALRGGSLTSFRARAA